MYYCLGPLGEAYNSLTLNANLKFWQAKIDNWDNDRTTSHHRQYRFLRIPFGLKKASGSFRRAMEITFAAVTGRSTLIYLDGFTIFLRSVGEDLDRLWTLVGLKSRPAVSLNLEKCSLFEDRIKHLGHVVQANKLNK